MTLVHVRRSAAILLSFAAGACTDGVTVPAAPPPQALAALACDVDVAAGVLACASPGPAAGGDVRLAIIGGQDRNVRLASSGAAYDSATGIFSLDVTVQNLMGEALGGGAGNPGVQVFFSAPPAATRGTGSVEVHNADGEGIFTSAAQAFFLYPGVLEPGATTPSRRWEWSLPPSVDGFGFTVYVAAPTSAADGSRGLAFRSLSAAGQNACGVALDGEGWCWGGSGYGQIGAGAGVVTEGIVFRPAKVRSGPWDTISVATAGACGLKAGAAWCWGTDLDGGLGTGSVSMGCGGTADYNAGCAVEPVRSAEGFTFRRISAGGTLQTPYRPFNRVSCGLTSAGQAQCWGSDAWGTLGDGAPYPASNPSPRPVAGNHAFAYVAVGYHHSCAIDTGAAAWCWGTEIAGELGHAQTTADIAATPGAVAAGLRFRQLDTGFNHTCGVTATGGQVWCWGSNYRGQLGTAQAVGTCDNAIPCSEVPVRVESNETFVQVTAGLAHTCALTADGRVFCWGTALQAGRGSNPEDAESCAGTLCYRTPRPVQSDERFVQVEAGREFTCAISRASRNAFCWGSYDGVAQGIGAPVYVPTRIVSPSGSRA